MRKKTKDIAHFFQSTPTTFHFREPGIRFQSALLCQLLDLAVYIVFFRDIWYELFDPGGCKACLNCSKVEPVHVEKMSNIER